ncbi:MAG: hypothetical protein ACO1O6_13155 [Bacteroidota bacterium]
MKKVNVLFMILLICSCKKSEFESCSNFNQLVGEWISNNTDTKNTLTFKSNGEVIQQYGTERKIKLKTISCSFEEVPDSDNFKFRIRSEDGLRNYTINASFDTIIKAARGYDMSDEPSLVNQMKFVKVK